MKKLVLHVIAVVAMAECSKRESIKNLDMVGDSIIVYSSDIYDSLLRTNKTLKIKTIDTFCNNETKRAQKDIKENRLYLFTDDVVFEKDEMAQLLNKHNIGIKTRMYYCVRSNNKFDSYCYATIMDNYVYVN